jgi:hypothetical protein
MKMISYKYPSDEDIKKVGVTGLFLLEWGME